MIVNCSSNLNCFQDPVANDIFDGFLLALQYNPPSAKEILDLFATLTDGHADYPFKLEYLTAIFSIKKFQFGRQVYYRKTEVAQVASALCAPIDENSQDAYTRVLSTKSNQTLPEHEGEQVLHWQEIQKLFARLGKTQGVSFWFPETSKREKKAVEVSMQDFHVRLRISCHVPSKMWNLTQLINAIRPVDAIDIGDPDVCVDVGGDADCKGLYVDLDTIERACRLLRVSPPPKPP